MQMREAHDRILSELEIQADPFAICALEGACSLGMGRAPGATLHYVLGGEGRLSFQGLAPIDLAPGRLVLVPASQHHSLHNHGLGQIGLPACRPAGLDLEEHLARGEGSGNMVVLCSTIRLGLRETHGVIDLLRAPLTLDLGQVPRAKQAMAALVEEVTQPRPGGRAMIRALLLQCVIEMLRQRLEAGDPAVTWLGALADPQLWRALQSMLDDPGAVHTLERLAEAAGMSRSRFAERFQAAYGCGPMGFLRELRLARAAQLLSEGQEPVKRVAQKVGFTSRSAFTRAFIEAWGQSPRAFRAGRAA
ncbi:transcriptional regulator, AraC family [Roseovarius azorensis]|uniref:Transcriptional regulator, AraC family n=2 Tax=Roseovarius azorensis TaxID=1287727 RepID=A0A1H7TFK9_9RHOB|nr:transcriptional regulator, AraC family [Roseovarius azorensis]